MRPCALRPRPMELAISMVGALWLFSNNAGAVDWRVIQDHIGAQVRRSEHWPYDSTPLFHSFQIDAPKDWAKSEAKLLFEQEVDGATLGEYPGHPGVTLVKDPSGSGACARISDSEFRLVDPIAIPPGHFILLRWKARSVSGDHSKGAYIETTYRDAQGKQVGKPVRHRGYSGQPGGGW